MKLRLKFFLFPLKIVKLGKLDKKNLKRETLKENGEWKKGRKKLIMKRNGRTNITNDKRKNE